jgi:hypothetical protein
VQTNLKKKLGYVLRLDKETPELTQNKRFGRENENNPHAPDALSAIS